MLIPSRNGPYAILEVYRSFASLLLPVQGSVLSHERQVSSRQVCTDRQKRKMWLFPKVFIPATQGLMGAFLSFVWSCIERIQIQLTLWGVKLTSERRGHSRDSSWEEKHLGHFVIWERIRPNISKQWSSEAGHSAEQAALTAATTSAPMLLREVLFLPLSIPVFHMSSVMMVMVLLFQSTLQHALPGREPWWDLSWPGSMGSITANELNKVEFLK